MSARYFIENGQTISPVMSFDWDGALVAFMFYDGAGNPVAVTGMPQVWHSLYPTGDIWKPVNPFSTGEWRFNGPAARVRISLAGVTGYTTYKVLVWRTDDAVPLIPDGAYVGLRALVTQPYTEANVKNGLQYNVRAVWPIGNTIASLAAKKLWFKTTTKPVIVKLRELQYIAEEIKLQLFSAPTGVTGGTVLDVHNYNAVAPVAATTQAKKNVTTVTNGAEFDKADPEHFFGSQAGGQRNVATALVGRERILPANSEFLVVITNTGAGDARVQYFLDFYEGGTDIPIQPQ